MKKKLKDIITQIRGVSYKPTDVLTESDGVPILRANNIQEDGINLDDLVYVDSKKIHEEQYLLDGDIVICASSGSKNLVGKAATYKESTKASFGAFCKVVRVNKSKDIAKEYIQQYFQSKLYRNAISELSIGANINNIKTEHIDALEINVPSLPEQQKIAAHLDSIQSAIDNKKQQLQQLDELVKSKFVEMFGENPVESGKWKVETLGNVAEIKIGPFGSLLHKCDYIQNGHCLINPSHIINGKIVKNIDLSVSDEKYGELQAYQLQIDDIVLGRRGEMGRCAVVRENGLLCGTGSMIIRPNGKLKVFFLNYIISNDNTKKYLEDNAVGVTMKNINEPLVKSICVPIIPIELQTTFAEYVQKIDSARLIIKTQLVDLQELLDSKMDEYFGE